MNIGHLQATLASGRADAQNSPEGPGPEQAARNRELLRAIHAINDNQVLGPGSELRFALDPDSGRPLIRIVDRVTDEVLNQIPPEDVIRMTLVLEELASRGQLA